jgi:hypothetical protein
MTIDSLLPSAEDAALGYGFASASPISAFTVAPSPCSRNCPWFTIGVSRFAFRCSARSASSRGRTAIDSGVSLPGQARLWISVGS